MSDAREVELFANLFTSYLFTSFDLVEEPGYRMVTSDWGCGCALCRRLVAAPHLRARRISDAEKRRARVLKVEHVRQLAVECRRQRELTEEAAHAMVDAAETATAAALAAYGAALVARCHGSTGEPALLALWREFAWTPSGAPRRDFELTADLVMDAEACLVRALAV